MVDSVSHPGDSPAFGEATLSNCEREQIHLPGSIQPHGCLLVVRAADLLILQASGNAARELDSPAAAAQNGLGDLSEQLAQELKAWLADETRSDSVKLLRLELGKKRLRRFDVCAYPEGPAGVIIEFEPAGSDENLAPLVERSFQSIVSALTLKDLFDDSVRIFEDLTGYDRVMLYRFDQDGHGQVIAERRRNDLEPYLGNFYPATDIPQMARKLYEVNRIRMLVDVEYEPVPLSPQESPASDKPLDMSLCQLRSVSPIHLQYLRNMGVSATLVVSLMVGGKLWGLVSCHHYERRQVNLEVRTAAVLLAEMLATRIAALEGYARSETEVFLKLVEKRIIEAIASEGEWKNALFSKSQELLKLVNATGAVLAFEGQIHTEGEVPATQDIKGLIRWMDENSPHAVYSTRSLGLDLPEFQSMIAVASGLIAVPLSRSGGEYLFWFRPERRHTVTWGGNPNEPHEIGETPQDLSPRRSFAKWYNLVEGTADAWTVTEIAAARRVGESIEDMVYQFRAVRLLIAQDQISQLTSEVREAKQPVVVADRSGRLLLVNDAFYQVLPEDHAELRTVYDLPQVFENQDKMRDLVEILLRDQHTGRGELKLRAQGQEQRTLLLRADPVFAELGRVLGYVLFFADITDRLKIELGKKQFQNGIVAIVGDTRDAPGDQRDLLYRNLLASAVNNAKLAAMEVSDDMDFESVPVMLDSIRSSVSNTSELIHKLLELSQQED